MENKTFKPSRNKGNEGKKRPVCACGAEMTFVAYSGYYDKRWFWSCENPDCKAIEIFEPDIDDRGRYG